MFLFIFKYAKMTKQHKLFTRRVRKILICFVLFCKNIFFEI